MGFEKVWQAKNPFSSYFCLTNFFAVGWKLIQYKYLFLYILILSGVYATGQKLLLLSLSVKKVQKHTFFIWNVFVQQFFCFISLRLNLSVYDLFFFVAVFYSYQCAFTEEFCKIYSELVVAKFSGLISKSYRRIRINDE